MGPLPRRVHAKGPYESTLHKNRVSSRKRVLEGDLCPGVCTLKGPYESTLHKNRVLSGKRVFEWDLCPGARSHPLHQCTRWRDPTKVPFIKMGMLSRKRACVWDLCLRAHSPTPSQRTLALALALSSPWRLEVALTLLLTTKVFLYIAHITTSSYQGAAEPQKLSG